jgi:tRNA A37 threonylcarbamoyladenosine dehydratase
MHLMCHFHKHQQNQPHPPRKQGVGSHAAHMLLRSGVGRLRLVDFDQVTLSSLNRHAVAVRADVGISKAACLERHFREILPEADIESLNIMFTEETVEEVLGGSPDFVFDAIDNIDTKVTLGGGRA